METETLIKRAEKEFAEMKVFGNPRKYLITQARQNFDDFLDAIDSKVGPEGYTLLTGSAGMIKLNGVGRRLLPREPIEDKRYDRLQNGFEETYVLNPAGTSTMSMLQYPDSGAIEIMYLSTLVGLPPSMMKTFEKSPQLRIIRDLAGKLGMAVAPEVSNVSFYHTPASKASGKQSLQLKITGKIPVDGQSFQRAGPFIHATENLLRDYYAEQTISRL